MRIPVCFALCLSFWSVAPLDAQFGSTFPTPQQSPAAAQDPAPSPPSPDEHARQQQTYARLVAALPPIAVHDPDAPDASPLLCVARFFRQIGEGRVDEAYSVLLKGSKIAEQPKDVQLLKTKTQEAVQTFGEITAFEPVQGRAIGTRLLRLTCLSIGRVYPIRWRFYFYKPEREWRLIDIRIDDRLPLFFEEPAGRSGED